MQTIIENEIKKLISTLTLIGQDPILLRAVEEIAGVCASALKNGNKLLFAGNGGSAADAQHLVAELVVRLHHNRSAMAAIALTTDTSILTAVSNDFGYEHLFSRQVEALGHPGDVLIGISTSGKSKNILSAFEMARSKQLITIGLTGAQAPLFNEHCDYVLNVPSTDTQKIQECHIMFGHIICLLIETAVCGGQMTSSLKQTVAV